MFIINAITRAGFPGAGWQVDTSNSSDDTVKISFSTSEGSRRESIKWLVEKSAQINDDPRAGWMSYYKDEFWLFDLDLLKKQFEQNGLTERAWFKGKVVVRVEIDAEIKDVIDRPFTRSKEIRYETKLDFYIDRNCCERVAMRSDIPHEISKSLEDFKADFPSDRIRCFIMMRFGTTSAHSRFADATKAALSRISIEGLRADSKQYHDDNYWNIITYIFGCHFGVAIFDRVESDAFNPNVALEVGYMFGIGKKVCLLKDTTISNLSADLIGKLYKPFDPQDPETTIPPQLDTWVRDHQRYWNGSLSANTSGSANAHVTQPRSPALSENARYLILEADADNNGTIIFTNTMSGTDLYANGKHILKSGNARARAQWKATLDELCSQNLLECKGEIYSLTHLGFEMAKKLRC